MSDYISREQVIDVLKETGIIQDNDLGHLVVDEINRIPTLDEKEIIRKSFERVVERLEEFTEQTYYKSVEGDMYAGERNKAYHNAIKTVKEECGISE